MSYGGNQITWGRLATSLKEKFGEPSKYKEVPAKGALELPSTYENGLTVMRPTGAMAKTWYDLTVKTPSFSDTRDIIVVLTNCIDGYVTEQYIWHKYYATGGTEKFESSIGSVWLRAATKRVEIPPASPQFAWVTPIKTLPMPSVPNPNSVWSKLVYSEDLTYDTASDRLATIAFGDTWIDTQPMLNASAPPAVMQDRTNNHVAYSRFGYDILTLGSGYSYEVVVDLSFFDFSNLVAAIRVDIFDDLQSAKDLNYANSKYTKVYYTGFAGLITSLPTHLQGKNSFQFEIPLIGKTNTNTHLVISVCDATDHTSTIRTNEGSIVFKLSRQGSSYLI